MRLLIQSVLRSAANAKRGIHTTSAYTKEAFSPSTYTPVAALSSDNIGARLSRTILHTVPEEEAKLRIELAAAYRLFDHFSWNDDVVNHLTVSITEPDGSKSFLINPYGLRYDEITASSLLKIDAKGNVLNPGVVGDIFTANKAGFVIHSAIHATPNTKAHAVLHCHEPTITGIASTKDGFISSLSQTSSIIGPVAYHDFEGIVVDEKEQATIVKNLGDKEVLLLRNHGVITTGQTIGGAWYRMNLLLKAAEIQKTTQSIATAGGGIYMPKQEAADKAHQVAKTFSGHTLGVMEFSAYMRMLDKMDPSYRL
ncbi:hypothetical protein MVES1_001964 [Malassezia vespertilionis]|uniref:Class II aldolase/adducin N-terminal domain-containing protein n=1 Tax=Malassezia vespertilionis TaxID=2020962 RepID=A0A2N1JBM9_9BASI|nr:uncharacterized protein MVES1_001964 [Malassezia vespertilionis]PKI83960.1 hypothetical protein MVES_001860 [Malassezia vespertilionis]WFD06610.1 hypothetical protein MVES1_001964 [Malassezia vespertilionis]